MSLGGKRPQTLTLRVGKGGFARQAVTWEGGDIPEEWTARMPRATTIGGLIQSQAGGAVAGAVITVLGTTRDAVGQVIPVEFGQVTGDDYGRWACDSVPRGFEGLSLKVTHAEFMPSEFEQESDQNDTTNVVATAALGEGSAVLGLVPALCVAGVVLDERRQPVAARVYLQHGENLSERKQTRANAQGQFLFWLTEPGKAALSVSASGWAPRGQGIEVERRLKPVELVLGKGRRVRGRVVDTEGQPVTGAVVESAPSAEVAAAEWRAVVDEEGRFTWDGAPAETIGLSASKAGFRACYVEAEPGATGELEYRLERSFRLFGKVVDAGTKAPVADEDVMLTTGAFGPGMIQYDSEFFKTCTDEAGGFAFTHVPPGTYDLRLEFNDADENGNRFGPPIGTLNREVVVPSEPPTPTDEPLDLGELKLQVR